MSDFDGVDNCVLIQGFFSVLVNTILENQQYVIFNQMVVITGKYSKQGTPRREGFKIDQGAEKGSNLIPQVHYN